MTSEDTSYYRQRAVTERAMALSAERQDVREIHEDLARQYEALVNQTELRIGHPFGHPAPKADSEAA